jgi:hypothetical protein
MDNQAGAAITSKKTAGFESSSVSHGELALPYENPGEGCSPPGDRLFILNCSLGTSSDLRFRRALMGTSDKIL